MSETLEEARPRAPKVARPQDSESSLIAAAPGVGRKRIVIVGGGFAGIAAVRALKHCEADVVLIDRRNHHIFQPLLYQVATAVLGPSEIAAPIRQLEARQANLHVMLADVVGIDSSHRTVDALVPGIGIRKLRFDLLVVATGTLPSYFDN